MATYQKRGNRVTATVRISPNPATSATFDTMRDAKKWAAETELKLRNEKKGKYDHIITRVALEEFRDSVIAKKNVILRETGRINYTIERLKLEFPLHEGDKDYWVAYRETRLEEVKPSTVRRDLLVMSSFYNWCVEQKLWLAENPIHQLKLPKDSNHRERVISQEEIDKLLPRLNPEMKIIFQLALETGMRQSEICGLTWDRCRLDEKYLFLDRTKNGRPREVPLSQKAIELIKQREGMNPVKVFDYTAANASAYFALTRIKNGMHGFTFHDARHTAATRIARKLTLLDLCKMFGWSDPKRAMIYYNPTASEIASRL